jgi:hypothetical protein
MKLIVTSLVIVLFFSSNFQSQVSFSCTYQQVCFWNENTEEYEDCQGKKENSLFKMNADETMFTHTTEEMQSTYYVNSSEYNSINDVYTYRVTSDAGNDYYYIFDIKNKEIRIVLKQEERTLLLTFTVKAIF